MKNSHEDTCFCQSCLVELGTTPEKHKARMASSLREITNLLGWDKKKAVNPDSSRV